MHRWVWLLLGLIVSLTSEARAGTPLATQQVAGTFVDPVMVKSPPGDYQRVMVVERAGRIRLIKNGVLQGTDFLNLTGQVQYYDERGLLDIAFHPNYASNGWFYVRYTEGTHPGPPHGKTVIKRFTRSANHDVADAGSGTLVLRLSSTIGFHLGGTIDFGRDGYLYVTNGDGNTITNAQDITDNLYGKILRIDVVGDAFPGDPDKNYSIPPTNPFAGPTTGDDEIWAYGLRNPYRTAFDRISGALWVCDVGGVSFEEVNYQASGVGGRNYGWPCMEANFCWTNQLSCGCSDAALVDPLFEYSHNNDNQAVTGGRMYRGCAIPDLVGTFFVGDLNSTNIWTFRYNGSVISELNNNRDAELFPRGNINSISGIGEDAYGELYICDVWGDKVFKVVPASAPPDTNFNGIPDSCEWSAGDVTRDGIVNVLDLLNVITNWGPCFECPADIAPDPTGDGTVNVLDLLLVITTWG